MFAERHFSGCEAHRREAAAVYRVLDRLSDTGAADLEPTSGIGDILRSRTDIPLKGLDSLDVVELVMALEAEAGVSTVSPRRSLDEQAWSAVVMRLLLGPAYEASTWDAQTIWSRSVRGVIDERVRLSGGCRCP